ncbi:MAG: hypothetical protein RQ864_02450 [Lutibacter sp.]|nr:hypothetical protein [Lutibacter sp.]
MLYSTLFISCSNTEIVEDLQMHIDNQELRADDTGGVGTPPPPPTPPPGTN